jgi:hypothetical protein
MAYGEVKYDLVESTPEYILIYDRGGREGHDSYMTVTNAAERVVKDLFDRGLIKDGQRLYYIDTEDQTDEILIEHRRFAGFRHGGPETRKSG